MKTMTLSDRLQALRARSGLSYRDIANLSGQHYGHVYKVMTGVTPSPNIDTVRKLAEAMGGTMGELFPEGDPAPLPKQGFLP